MVGAVSRSRSYILSTPDLSSSFLHPILLYKPPASSPWPSFAVLMIHPQALMHSQANATTQNADLSPEDLLLTPTVL